MSSLDKIIRTAIIPPFFVSLVVLTFVVFAQNLGRLSELLITNNASLKVTALIALAMLPQVLIFSLPLSYLIGLLIGLSGLSGESQIVALRACGVPLQRMLRPITTLGAFVGILTGIISLLLLPETNRIFDTVKNRVDIRAAASQIQPRIFNEDFPNLVVYLDDLAVDKRSWSKVFLVDSSDPKSPRTFMAHDGTWVSDGGDGRLQLHLEQGTIYEVNPDDPSKDNVSIFAKTDIPIELNRSEFQARDAEVSPRRKPSEETTVDLWKDKPGAEADERIARSIELHRRLSIPFAVLPFSLLGLTLGISTRKGGRTYGFVLSMLFVVLWYILFFNGIRLVMVQKVAPVFGLWAANIILATLGVLMLLMAEQTRGIGHWIGHLRWKAGEFLSKRLTAFEARHDRIHVLDEAITTSTRKLAGLRFPRVLDIYVSRGFFAFFLWSLLVCGSLFVILTLFDLLDDIIRNSVTVSAVFRYFVFLTPQILMWVVPMSVLLAILVNFGILERYSEVTALKAGGWSLYRIAMPVLLLAGGLCIGMYVLQDYILPYANIQQDSIRNMIKGRPTQTWMRPQHKWIFGESKRIFNYDYFDANQDRFIQLNIFEVDFQSLKMLRRIHAERATIEPSGNWLLEDGWVRNFQDGQQGFRRITSEAFQFPERASYFKKDIFQPGESSKLTYFELRNHIDYLKKAGYNATELQVELYTKISFPLSCLVVALLGVPFSFSMGKKGAFFGIAASIAIAMSYWGIYSIFEQMGAYGMLVPLLAAWAPNVLFGAAGLAMLFTIRT